MKFFSVMASLIILTLWACKGQRSDLEPELGTGVSPEFIHAEKPEDDSWTLKVADYSRGPDGSAVQISSDSYRFVALGDARAQKRDWDNLRSLKPDRFVRYEFQKHKIDAALLMPVGKVFSVRNKKPLSPGCYKVMHDTVTGLVFYFKSDQDLLKYFETTVNRIESPFSGTWCLGPKGALKEFRADSSLIVLAT